MGASFRKPLALMVLASFGLLAGQFAAFADKVVPFNGVTRSDVPKQRLHVLQTPGLKILSEKDTPVNVTVDLQRIGDSDYFRASDNHGNEAFYQLAGVDLTEVSSGACPANTVANIDTEKFVAMLPPNADRRFVGKQFDKDSNTLLIGLRGEPSVLFDVAGGKIISKPVIAFGKDEEKLRYLGRAGNSYRALMGDDLIDLKNGKVEASIEAMKPNSVCAVADDHKTLLISGVNLTNRWSFDSIVAYDLGSKKVVKKIPLKVQDVQNPVVKHIFPSKGKVYVLTGSSEVFAENEKVFE